MFSCLDCTSLNAPIIHFDPNAVTLEEEEHADKEEQLVITSYENTLLPHYDSFRGWLEDWADDKELFVD